MKPVIALTLGDPGGIGPEIIAAAFKKKRSARFKYLLFGTPESFKRLGKFPFNENVLGFRDVSREARALLARVRPRAGFDFRPGRVSAGNAAAAYAALQLASMDANSGNIQAIVTAPVNKTSMRLIDPKFHGHTEFLAEAAKTSKFAMMFVSPRLKVTLTTIHIPISKVSSQIKKAAVLEKIRLTHDFLKKHFRISKPELAVCALNPHGRETGTEDDAEILPAVLAAQKQGIRASGPFSADQLFFEAYHGRYDALISMYHDQGLAPFKMIAFRDGVNVTLGLPFIRTSPDHGTAFDIAYKKKADPVSFESALALAEKLLGK